MSEPALSEAVMPRSPEAMTAREAIEPRDARAAPARPDTLAARLVRRGLFPLMMFGGVTLAASWMQAGVEAPAVVVILSLTTALVVLLAERRWPHDPRWNVPRDDIGTDLTHTVLSMMLIPEALRAGFLALVVWLAGEATVPWSLWPDWHWLPSLALALVVTELGYYALHRAMHTFEPLWRLHAVHHSAPRLYWLNAGRFHPLDAALIFTTQLPMLILLGCPLEIIALFLVVGAIHGLFQHANVDVQLGWLNHVFAMAELHRWHHARTGAGAHANYGGNLIVWDTLFGTRYLPSGSPDAIGFEGDAAYPKRWRGQLTAPFRRAPR